MERRSGSRLERPKPPIDTPHTQPGSWRRKLTNDLAIFKAFSDETRLRILFLLSEGELCVCEIVAVLDMPQGKVSRHLSVLKRAGLVSDRREGLWIYYSRPEPSGNLERHLADYLREESDGYPAVLADRERLDALKCDGVVCVPQGSSARPR